MSKNKDKKLRTESFWKVYNFGNDYLFKVCGSFYDEIGRTLVLFSKSIYNDIDFRYTTIRTVNATVRYLRQMLLIKTINSSIQQYDRALFLTKYYDNALYLSDDNVSNYIQKLQLYLNKINYLHDQ